MRFDIRPRVGELLTEVYHLSDLPRVIFLARNLHGDVVVHADAGLYWECAGLISLRSQADGLDGATLGIRNHHATQHGPVALCPGGGWWQDRGDLVSSLRI